MIIKFAFTPWVEALGIQNTFIVAAAISAITMIMPVPLMIWGKTARIRTAKKYREYALQQPARVEHEEGRGEASG